MHPSTMPVKRAVILAGGFGTRLSEETYVLPKPMIGIGSRPIIWHIMMIYSRFNIREFVICAGYKGYVIKEFFANYYLHTADMTFDLRNNSIKIHGSSAEPWMVTVVDTGEATMTAGRLRRVREHLAGESFCVTYGDGLADIDMDELLLQHRKAGVCATVTAVRPPSRFGVIETDEADKERVIHFAEKPSATGGWINGGFFVMNQEVFDYIGDDSTSLEQESLPEMARDGQLAVYRHEGFWLGMDTQRDRRYLEELWDQKRAPWKTW